MASSHYLGGTTTGRPRRVWRWFLVACVLSASGLLVGVLGAYQWEYRGRVYPGVSVAGQVAGGLPPTELTAALAARRDSLLTHGLWLDLGGELVNLPLEITSSDPDLARVPVQYDLADAVAQAYGLGRGGTLWSQLVEPLRVRWFGYDVQMRYDLDESAVQELLRSVLSSRETQPRPARLSVEGGVLRVLSEQDGVLFDYVAATREVKDHLARMDPSPMALRLIGAPAPFTAAQTADAFAKAQILTQTTTPTLVYGSRRWEVSRGLLLQWLQFEAGPDGRVRLGFNPAAVAEFLAPVSAVINVTPQDAKFRLENDRVVEFQVNRDGKEVDVASTTARLAQEYLEAGSPAVRLAVAVAPAKFATGDLNDLGIQELLGVGRSNFAGSPKNRRLNIAQGVKSLNGILIAPDEEFSLLKALGPVDGEHGYLPELVIKGDRTTPEFGGGLCQIGTTTFRAALRSGLPITQRQSHSFRVRYYDPPGMDATIYDPAPDFRFTNDTGRHILFLAEIDGDELVFSFYGSKDGRVAEVPDKAVILSTIPSGPVRYIETDDLKPGEKKLVEKPAPGGTATFHYKVTYPDGRVIEQDFKSAYRPWAETWLVGRTPTGTEAVLGVTTP
ncbi:MAG: VanW family protein [bacterium]|nr:VanW family protein [bacterium]